VQVHQSTQKQLKTAVDPIFPICYNISIERQKGAKMKRSTAFAQLDKECRFLGIGFFELIKDIQINGRMVYCEKTVEAYQVYMEMYAQVDE
jgi:hypothetical protein